MLCGCSGVEAGVRRQRPGLWYGDDGDARRKANGTSIIDGA